MKFNPFNWQEVKTNEKIQAPKGWLRLRASSACPLYITPTGFAHEVCAGVGSVFDLDLSGEVTYRLEAPKGVRLFVFVADQTTALPAREVFTNIDRMPDESGNLLEVKRAVRAFQLEQRSVLREIRAERAALAALKAQSVPGGDPVPQPAPGGEDAA